MVRQQAYVGLILLLCCVPWLPKSYADEEDYYRLITISASKAPTASRSKNWKPSPEGLPLEISGMTVLDDSRLAVAIRKGEVWILDGVYDDPPENVQYHRYATALHEPLGLLLHNGDLYTAQRSELTRLRDTDGDEIADEYLTAAKGWGVTGNYHEYAYGPKRDGEGNLWITLNVGIGLKGDQLKRVLPDGAFGYRQGRWRGWGMKLTPSGEFLPMCAGMRSPSGIGVNGEGDMFYTDQQGNWVATNSLHHMREGAFFHHAEALASIHEPGSPLHDLGPVPDGLPLAAAVEQFPALRPPAVWFPYKKVGQSATDIMLDQSQGKFGPFHGQFFVGEFTQAGVNRVFLEKVDGEYQGACFPFRLGFGSAVLRLAQGKDGSMFAGLTNRGWSSLGSDSYGLQRLVWTGRTPFEIREVRAQPDGFELVFTLPVDPKTAANPLSYRLSSFTYFYHSTYGSDEIQKQSLTIRSAVVSDDRTRVRLKVDGLRRYFVHEIIADGVRDGAGNPLLHPDAYYTLNRIPDDSAADQVAPAESAE
jgi:hypothetical protein